MRSKRIFSFNEERDAEKIVINGFPDGIINYNDMYLIAKYFREMFGYGEIRLERELIKFCQGQDKNFNPVLDSRLIQKWVNSAMNYRLRKIESVVVSQEEINFLKKIETPKHRKLLFITLVFSKALKQRNTRIKKKNLKISDNYYIHYNNFGDIIRLSGIKNTTETELANIFGMYKHCFYFYKPEKELIRIEFVDKFPQTKMTINKLESPMEYYDLFFSEDRLPTCSVCGNPFTKNSNRQKACENCTKVLNQQRVANWRKRNSPAPICND